MLQGSLSDFTLDEMLGLLATTQKTGQMRIDGDRGAGAIWLADGSLAAARLGAEERPIEDALFELLRFNSGTFSFSAGAQAPAGSEPHDLDEVLDAALARVAEWRTVEAVVPSMAHVLAPAEVAPTPQVTLDMDEWATLVAVGERSTVKRVCDRLGLGEVDGSRRLKQMIERALLTINEPGSTPTVRPQLTTTDAPAEAVRAISTPGPLATEPVTNEAVATEAVATEAVATEPVDFESVGTVAAETVPPAPVAEVAASTPPPPMPAPPGPAAVEAPDFSTTEPAPIAGFGEGRPPMPPPPSPSEIASFGEELQRSEGFNAEELAEAETTEEDSPSLLMRYLKSDS